MGSQKNDFPNNWVRVNGAIASEPSMAHSSVSPAPPRQSSFSKILGNHSSNSLPRIAIKRKDNDSPSSMNTEVVLLNGCWDTSNKIPNIIAEMHNVNIEELRALQNSSANKHLECFQKHDCIEIVTPSPSSDSGIEGDCSDGNLSWLLNYKIHELPPVPDSASAEQQAVLLKEGPNNFVVNQVYIPGSNTRTYFDQREVQNINVSRVIYDKKNNEQNPEDSKGNFRCSGPKKPPFTYTELIEHALTEKGELTVSGIYQWISDHFPFYKQNDDRWKNSVRHNLSINPHFRKGSKAVHGAGHLWTIAQPDDRKIWHIKKQRMQQFIQTSHNEWNREKQLEMELATATASILPENFDGNCGKNDGIHQNGHKKQNIEVEYVNVIDVTDGLGDFLCPPVSKEQVVEECGLSGDFLITDLNPTSLGLNLTESEIITAGNLYDDFNFQCYELQTE